MKNNIDNAIAELLIATSICNNNFKKDIDELIEILLLMSVDIGQELFESETEITESSIAHLRKLYKKIRPIVSEFTKEIPSKKNEDKNNLDEWPKINNYSRSFVDKNENYLYQQMSLNKMYEEYNYQLSSPKTSFKSYLEKKVLFAFLNPYKLRESILKGMYTDIFVVMTNRGICLANEIIDLKEFSPNFNNLVEPLGEILTRRDFYIRDMIKFKDSITSVIKENFSFRVYGYFDAIKANKIGACSIVDIDGTLKEVTEFSFEKKNDGFLGVFYLEIDNIPEFRLEKSDIDF